MFRRFLIRRRLEKQRWLREEYRYQIVKFQGKINELNELIDRLLDELRELNTRK